MGGAPANWSTKNVTRRASGGPWYAARAAAGHRTGPQICSTRNAPRLQFHSRRAGGRAHGQFEPPGGCQTTLGSDAQITAGTRGKGDDLWFNDCEFAWSDAGVILVGSDYGAVTQARFRDCVLHDLTTHIAEALQAGSSADALGMESKIA